MKREIGDYIEDIIKSMKNSVKFVKGMTYDEFIRDTKTIYAVIRTIEIMGEASKRIPGEIKDKYPEVPWKYITGARDKLIHEYHGVDLEIVWTITKKEIPPLIPIFKKMLKDNYG